MLSSISAASHISSFPVVGFSGSRHQGFGSRLAGAVCSALPSSVPVAVGCARGVDLAVRSARPLAGVFHASSFGSGRSAFARRSAAFVQSLASSGGVLVSFPAGACPAGVRVSRQFRGCGSGSWGSVALAIGLGVPVLCFVPCGQAAPWALLGPLASRFVVAPFGGGCSLAGCWVWAAAPAVQGSLF